MLTPWCTFHIIHVADKNLYISATLEYYIMLNRIVMGKLRSSMNWSVEILSSLGSRSVIVAIHISIYKLKAAAKHHRNDFMF